MVSVKDSGKGITPQELIHIFELYFPRSLGNTKEITSKENEDIFIGSGESILIVDDGFQQRDIALRLLESLEYKVKSVRSGRGL